MWKASGVASCVASWVRQRPPAPRNVGSPDEAESPAPSKARMRFEERRASWKEARSAGGIAGVLAVEAILMKARRGDTVGYRFGYRMVVLGEGEGF